MLLKIQSLDQAKQTAALQPNYWNIISISAPDLGWPNFKFTARKCIRLNFHDLDVAFFASPGWKDYIAQKNYIIPTKEEIKKGLDFGREHSDGPLLIHCHAGISRSSAIAWLILYDKFRDVRFVTQHLYQTKETIHPNTLIIDLGLSIIHSKTDEKLKVFSQLLSDPTWVENHSSALLTKK